MRSTAARLRTFVPWAMAAGLALAAVWAAQLYVSERAENGLLQSEAQFADVELRLVRNRLAQDELVNSGTVLLLERSLREDADLRGVRVAVLTQPSGVIESGLAVVVWNPETQRGILSIARLPATPAGRDYQLWIIPSGANPTPVNASVFRLDGTSIGKRIGFFPKARVPEAAQFAVSLEAEGGAAMPSGPRILLSQELR